MAVRLINAHTQPLVVDLRDGDVLLLAPGERSAALREELLYDNHHLPEWERAGWVVRVRAPMQEVLDAEQKAREAQERSAVAPPVAEPPPAAKKPRMAKSARKRVR